MTGQHSAGALLDTFTAAGVIPVFSVETPQDAVDVCTALHAGGLNIAEITFRTTAAASAIHAAVDACPDMRIGAGTVLGPNQLDAAKAAGARFAVAPGLNPDVVRHADAIGLDFVPGVCTPSDIEAALALGKRLLKFFPAEASGGLKTLKALHGPYGHLGLRFVPTGGITFENMNAYRDHPAVPAVGGSWIASTPLIRARDWAAIERNARQAVTAQNG